MSEKTKKLRAPCAKICKYLSHIQTTYKPQKAICDLSHSLCWSPLTDLGHISSVTYVCHPLWFVCGHRKEEILMSPLSTNA